MQLAILALTALWHGLAFWHFALFPVRTLARTTHERPVSAVAAELLRFLGALNAGFSWLAIAAIWRPEARVVAFATLAVANLSQMIVDVRVQRLALAKGAMFRHIMFGDALFTFANLVACLLAAR